MLNFNADLIKANIIAMQQAQQTQQAKGSNEALQQQKAENKLPSNAISTGEVQDLMSVHAMYVQTMVNGVNNVDTVEFKNNKPKTVLGSLTGLVNVPETKDTTQEKVQEVKTKWSKNPPTGVKSTPEGIAYVDGDTWIVKGDGYREIYEMRDNEWIKINTTTTSISTGGILA